MSQGGFLLLSTVAFFLTGVGLYAADKKITVAIRRFLHGWTRPESEPFPESKERGLVYRQPARRRFIVAGAISLLQTILSVQSLSYNPLLELMTLLIEAPIMVLGTYLGDRVARLFGQAQPVFDAIDRIDAGESSARREARGLLQDLTGRRLDGTRKASSSGDKAEVETSEGRQAAASEDNGTSRESEAPSEAAGDDPRELMRRYTGE